MSRKLKIRLVFVFLISLSAFLIILNGKYFFSNVSYYFYFERLTPASPNRGEPAFDASPAVSAPPIIILSDTAQLVIPKIRVSVPIVFSTAGSDEEAMLAALDYGVVHYSNTVKPGLSGAAMILGHSSDYIWKRNPYGAVFSLLGKLNSGDDLYVEYGDGRRFNFKVKQSFVFNPAAADPRLQQIQTSKTSKILLISCWPVGSISRRIAVEAVLVN